MSPAAQILYRIAHGQAEIPMVILRDPTELHDTRAAVIGLMETLRLSFVHKRDAIETAEWRITFAAREDLDMLCGVRADLMFARLSEWTEQELNESLKPFLSGGILGCKLTRALLKGGHMTTADLRPRSIDDYLVNLDPHDQAN